MSNVSNQISLFCSQIKNRRFNPGTLETLESLLFTKDVKSLLDVRSSLNEFLRSESLRVIREIKEKFFEGCLALRYEALIMRELRSSSNQWLEVSYNEWLTFAEHSLENMFYSIAKKACEKALSCLEVTDTVKTEADSTSEIVQVIEKIKRLKDIAMISASSRSVTLCQPHCKLFGEKSVQAQAAEHLKKKTVEHGKNSPLVFKEKKQSGSTLFRNGIKKHNIRKLQQHQRLADY